MFNAQENGRRLRELRGNRRIETVAAAVKISASSLAMYESGKRNPRDEVKIALADYFGTTVNDIFFANQVHFK